MISCIDSLKKKVKCFCVTGGIGSGKSTLIDQLKTKFKFNYLHLDNIGRIVRNTNPVEQKILKTFGTIDSKELRSIVFNNKDKLKLLEDIVLPAISDHIKDYAGSIYFSNIPVIFEMAPTNLDILNAMDSVILVTCEKNKKIERIMKRDNCTENLAISMINNQISDEELLKRITKPILVLDKEKLDIEDVIKFCSR